MQMLRRLDSLEQLQGETKSASQLLEKAHEGLVKTLGDDHPDLRLLYVYLDLPREVIQGA